VPETVRNEEAAPVGSSLAFAVMDTSYRQTPPSTPTGLTALRSVTIEVLDTAALAFPSTAFGLGSTVTTQEASTAAVGAPPFMLSLVVAQPATVDSMVATAVGAGSMVLRPAAKSFWGYGGILRAPGGAIWKIASSSKRDTGPATRRVDDVVLLLGVADVKASRRFYVERGLSVKRSFGGKYAEFDAASGQPTLALYPRRALAKDAGLPVDRLGSPPITLHGGAGTFTDPDGFTWQPIGDL
jgi:predicted lactoylglutathione lyase